MSEAVAVNLGDKCLDVHVVILPVTACLTVLTALDI